MSNLKKRISSPKNKFKGKSFQMKINGKFISLDPDNNYAEFEFTKAKWSWFFFLEQIQNIRGKWISKVTPIFYSFLLSVPSGLDARYGYILTFLSLNLN